LRSFQEHLPQFAARGTQIVAISVDSPEESKSLCRSQGYTFPLLSDRDAATIRSYGVLHPKAGEDGRDIARPAEFLVDRNGTIRWVNLTGTILARLRPETVINVIDTTMSPARN
jgi:peroxiredoxin